MPVSPGGLDPGLLGGLRDPPSQPLPLAGGELRRTPRVTAPADHSFGDQGEDEDPEPGDETPPASTPGRCSALCHVPRLAVAAHKVVHLGGCGKLWLLHDHEPPEATQVKLHSRAKTTPQSRALLVRRVLAEGWSRREAAQALGVSLRTAHKWIVRFRQEGEGGLRDRSSRPHRIPRRHRDSVAELVVALRREHRLSAVQLGHAVGLPRATVGRILRRHRLSRWRDLEPRLPARRYEHEHPGDLVHLDIKKLGRIDGVGHRPSPGRRLGVCPRRRRRLQPPGLRRGPRRRARGDHGRFPRARPGVVRGSGNRRAAHPHRQRRGLRVVPFADLCQRRGIRHRRTRPYRPRTTARRSASSRPASESGPTSAPTPPPSSEHGPYLAGSTTTITTDYTPLTTANHPPLE